MNKKENWKKMVVIRLPSDVHKKLKLYCLNNNTNIQELMSWLIECLFKNKE